MATTVATDDRAQALRRPLPIWRDGGGALTVDPGAADADTPAFELPAMYPEWLGSPAFRERHGTRFAYVVGEMAGGIAGPALVAAAVRAGCAGFLGAAGLSPDAIRRGVHRIREDLGSDRGWGVNVIHTPTDPAAEEAVIDLLLEEGVTRASASAFMAQSDALIRYTASGLQRGSDGRPRRAHHLVAKVSRPEVARHFLSPPASERLQALVDRGRLTPLEAELAGELPLASDLTVEADSGGHTDNGSLPVLLASMLRLRETLAADHGLTTIPAIGAAGGLGTPDAVAGAFAAGADYVLTGSINQATREADTSERVKAMLAGADITDATMAPAADMFELGAQVQVLGRGSVFPGHARTLYRVYRQCGGLDDIPEADREHLEHEIFEAPLATIQARTTQYFAERNPAENERARRDPKHRLALVLRWYLGRSIRWAQAGDEDRAAHYQIWCGPAMGAFNRWAAGSFLAEPAERTVAQVALNLLENAAHLFRTGQCRALGVDLPANAFVTAPRRYRLEPPTTAHAEDGAQHV